MNSGYVLMHAFRFLLSNFFRGFASSPCACSVTSHVVKRFTSLLIPSAKKVFGL